MQALSKAALDILARLRAEAAKHGPGAELVMGGMVDSTPPRGMADGGGYGTLGADERPDWLKETDEPGWELLITLHDKPRR
jgi:hypothetical protein